MQISPTPLPSLILLISLFSHSTLISSTEIHNLKAVSSFLDCLGPLVDSYKFNLDEGEILVIPLEGRALNTTDSGKDEVLVRCIARYHDEVNLVMYGSRFDDEIVRGAFGSGELLERMERWVVGTIPTRRGEAGMWEMGIRVNKGTGSGEL